MKVYAPPVLTVSALNATGWDDNLVVPAARQITVDHITETTAGHDIIVNAAAEIHVDHIAETTGAHGAIIAGGVVLGAAGAITKTYAATTRTEVGAHHSGIALDGIGTGGGEYVTLVNTRIVTVTFWIADGAGAPTGNLYCRVLSESGDVVEQATTILNADTDIDGAYAEKTFTFTSKELLNGNYYIMVVAANGGGANYVAASGANTTGTRSTARRLVAPATFTEPDAAHATRGTSSFGGIVTISG